MKKLLMGLTLLVLLFVGKTAKAEEFSSILNFAGDTIYLIGDRAFASGTGIVLGTFYKDIFEIKATYVFSHKREEVSDKAGVGLGVNIVQALRELGVKGVPDWLNSSVGVLGLVDLKDSPSISAGLYVTIIKIDFK